MDPMDLTSFSLKAFVARSLPNFADEKTGRPMLRPSDSEALLSYLTVPYLRQPLLLSFFTTQDRSNCLRQGTLQKILQVGASHEGSKLPKSR